MTAHLGYRHSNSKRFTFSDCPGVGTQLSPDSQRQPGGERRLLMQLALTGVALALAGGGALDMR